MWGLGGGVLPILGRVVLVSPEKNLTYVKLTRFGACYYIYVYYISTLTKNSTPLTGDIPPCPPFWLRPYTIDVK